MGSAGICVSYPNTHLGAGRHACCTDDLQACACMRVPVSAEGCPSAQPRSTVPPRVRIEPSPACWPTHLDRASWALNPVSAPPQGQVKGCGRHNHSCESFSTALSSRTRGGGTCLERGPVLCASAPGPQWTGEPAGGPGPSCLPLPAAAWPAQQPPEFSAATCCHRPSYLAAAGGGADPTPPDPAAPTLRYLVPAASPHSPSSLRPFRSSSQHPLGLALSAVAFFPASPCLSSLSPQGFGVGGGPPKAELTPSSTQQLEHVLPKAGARPCACS